MKQLMMITFACALLGASAVPAYAADGHQHSMAETQMSYAANGEVVEIDNSAGKVKLKHSAIPELKWPAMTMFFAVADKSQLDSLKVGERVRFDFVKVDGDSPRITRIGPVK